KVAVAQDGLSWHAGHLNIDLGRLIVGPFPADGNRDWNAEAVQLAGYCSSYHEHEGWEGAVQRRAISTVKALQMAKADTGNNDIVTVEPYGQLPLFVILPDPQDGIIIQDALNAGRRVHVTKNPVPVAHWRGPAYILEDPNTGAAIYQISGATVGGDTVDESIPVLSAPLGTEEWLAESNALLAM